MVNETKTPKSGANLAGAGTTNNTESDVQNETSRVLPRTESSQAAPVLDGRRLIVGEPQVMPQMYPGIVPGPAFRLPQLPQQPPQQPPPQQAGGPSQSIPNPTVPRQLVPVLIPVQSGQANNGIQVPQSAIRRRADGTFALSPEFLQQQQAQQAQQMQQQLAQLYAQAVNPNGGGPIRQLRMAPAQQMYVQMNGRLIGVPYARLQQPAQQQQQRRPAPVATALEEEEQEAAPQLAAENEQYLNVESLKAEEVFQQESSGRHGRKKRKQSKVLTHEIDGHMIIETTEPSISAHLDVNDFELTFDNDDDQSDKSYEGKEDAVLVAQAAGWMQNRLEMDKPRDERQSKESPQSHKPRGEKTKPGKRKSNELKSLLQMDFGPAENSRRAEEMLPEVIGTAETASPKETPKSRASKARRSTSGGSLPVTANGRPKRLLRCRDSTDKSMESKTRMDEEMDEEKQTSPAVKRRSLVRKKVPVSKTSKVEATTVPAAAAAHAAGQTPPSAATPPPLLQQLQLQPILPAAAAANAPSSPSTHVMDPVTCRQLSVEEVRVWVEQITGKSEVAQLFAAEDVDGETLLKLSYDQLRRDLKLTLGMAMKVHAAIEDIGKRRAMESDD